MGGFFATNSESRLSDGIAPFSRKGFGNPAISDSNGVTVASFQKLAVSRHSNLYHEKGTTLIGIGSYGYRDHFGAVALPLILHDHLAGKNPFARVAGHAVFIVQDASSTRLFTDKAGIYHCYCAQDADQYYISSSLLSVAGAAPRLSVSQQGVLEFLSTERLVGNETIFSNIRQLPGGSVFRLESNGLQAEGTYYDPIDVECTPESLAGDIGSYCRIFENCPHSIMAELSGGRDSRTIVAALTRAGISFELGSNQTNYSNKYDLITAMQVAKKLDREIPASFLYQSEFGELSDSQLNKGIDILELCRNVMRAARHVDYFEFRASNAEVIVGGVGGELLRDHVDAENYASVADLVKKKYVSPEIHLNKRLQEKYVSRLTTKLTESMDRLGQRDVPGAIRKIYYFEKMRFWCGGRISAWNQYSFRIHPLMDHLLTRSLFTIPHELFQGNEFQRRVIDLLSPGLGDVPFLDEIRESSDTTQPTWKALGTFFTNLPGVLQAVRGPRYVGAGNTPRRRLTRFYRMAKKSEYGLERHLGLLSTLASQRRLVDADLSKHIGVSPEDLSSPGSFGKYLMVGKIVERFKDKVSYESDE